MNDVSVPGMNMRSISLLHSLCFAPDVQSDQTVLLSIQGRAVGCAGIAAASRIKKSCLVLCTNSVSVDQWKYQFQLWSSLDSRDISRFTSQQKEAFTGVANVCVTTYTMIAYSGRRSEDSAKVHRQGQVYKCFAPRLAC